MEYVGALPRAWGFFWDGEVSLELAGKHWRSLLTVVLPTGKLTYLRFYSPTVFSRMAGACTETELSWLLGPLAHVFVPAERPADGIPAAPAGTNSADWIRISNPRLRGETPEAIARTYQTLDKTWWQVTEEHAQAFADVLERVYLDNLEQRVWEQYPELAEEIDAPYGDVRRFVADAVQDARACGFHTPEQEYRFFLLALHDDFNSANAPQARSALDMARRDPEAALVKLEEIMRNPLHE